jgi:hypothetical protein
MRLVAGLVLIPAAEEVARAEVRAEYAIEAARAVTEAARESRQIEREVGNATDSDLRDALRGAR